MYRNIPRAEIMEALVHLRDLHRQIKPSNDRERHALERRELVTKNLLSNLRRTGDHPTLSMLLEVADAFSLTVEGAHRLFGYDLAAIREYDLRLNGGRTHIKRAHQGLSAREVHRSLGMGNACDRERGDRRPHCACDAEQFAFRKGSSQSLGKVGCAARDHYMAAANHRHLHRLVSVGNVVMIELRKASRLIRFIYRVIAAKYHPVVSRIDGSTSSRSASFVLAHL